MQQGELIRGILTGDGAVNGLISGRCFPNELNEASDLPALVYREIIADRGHILTGEFDSLNQPLLEVECWAMTYNAMEQLAMTVIDLLDGMDVFVGSPPMELRSVIEDGGADDVGVYGTRRQHMRPVLVRLFY